MEVDCHYLMLSKPDSSDNSEDKDKEEDNSSNDILEDATSVAVDGGIIFVFFLGGADKIGASWLRTAPEDSAG